jgi:hypothetical protein
METIMVRYKTTSAAHADANAALVRAVFAELAAAAPASLSYACYRLEDGVSFMHVATVENRNQNPLVTLPAFRAFLAKLSERCDGPPVTTVLSVVGAYASKS